MKRGIDTNVLIYAQFAHFAEHGAVRRFLLEELRTADRELVLSPLVLAEFVHVVTDARRFSPPLTMGEACATSRVWLGHSNVTIVDADETVWLDVLERLERHGLGRKRVADTLFAATLFRHGVRQVITCNPRDFMVFPELQVIDPRVA